MDKESAILPKVINFRISNEQIDFCGQIEPIGLRFTLGLHIILIIILGKHIFSEFVKTPWKQRLKEKFGNKKGSINQMLKIGFF
jgi:hypothetical protein